MDLYAVYLYLLYYNYQVVWWLKWFYCIFLNTDLLWFFVSKQCILIVTIDYSDIGSEVYCSVFFQVDGAGYCLAPDDIINPLRKQVNITVQNNYVLSISFTIFKFADQAIYFRTGLKYMFYLICSYFR